MDSSGIVSLQNRVKKTQTLKNIDSDVGGDSSFSGLLNVRHVSGDTQKNRAVWSGGLTLTRGNNASLKGEKGSGGKLARPRVRYQSATLLACCIHIHVSQVGGGSPLLQIGKPSQRG